MHVCSQPSGKPIFVPVDTKESGPLTNIHSTHSDLVLGLYKQLAETFLGILILRGHTFIRKPYPLN